MKTAVSIPDDLFCEADALAKRLGKSRSQVYQEALSEYLLRRDPQALTSAMNEALSEVDSRPDPWLEEASRKALGRDEW